MISSRRRCVTPELLCGLIFSFAVAPTSQAAVFNSTQNGDWSTAATWNAAPPAGGPGAADSATVDTGDDVDYDLAAPGTITNVTVNGGGSLLTLQQDLTASGTTSVHNTGTLDLGGQTLTTNILDVGNWQSSGTIARTGGGTLSVTTLRTEHGSHVALAAGDTIGTVELQAFGNPSSVTTAATSNVTTNVFTANNSEFHLGADLVLSGAFATGHEQGGTVVFNGFDITSNATENKWWRAVTLDRTGGGNLNLNGRLRLVREADIELRAGDNLFTLETEGFSNQFADVAVTQELGDTTGITIDKNQEGGLHSSGLFLANNGSGGQSVLTLDFDADTPTDALLGDPADFDWALRWLGDHVAFLTNYADNTNQLVVNAPGTFSSADNIFYSDPGQGGDGYTYVGFAAPLTSVPEPNTLLLTLAGLSCVALRRRRSA